MKELAKKYNITKKDIALILERYGSLEKFYKEYVEGNISNEDEKKIAQRMIKDVIDIDGNPDEGYDSLWRELISYEQDGQKRQNMMFYSSKKLQQVVDVLEESMRVIVTLRSGIGTKTHTWEEIANQIGKNTRECYRKRYFNFLEEMNTK